MQISNGYLVSLTSLDAKPHNHKEIFRGGNLDMLTGWEFPHPTACQPGEEMETHCNTNR